MRILKEPKFDKDFFEKHQERLVKFANSWIGQRFFGFHNALAGIKGVKVCEIDENHITHSERLIIRDGKLLRERKSTFSTDRHFTLQLENAYAFLKKLVPISVASQLMEPSAVFGLALPLMAMTVTPFYPDAHPESTSVDGRVGYFDAAADFNEAHDATVGSYAASDATESTDAVIMYGNGEIRQINRAAFLFDTSALTGEIVSAATLGVYSSGHVDTISDGLSIRLVSVDLASNTDVVVGDYDGFGTAALATSDILVGTAATNDYVVWILSDPTGLAAIDKGGVSKFGLRLDYDCDDTEPTDKVGTAGMTMKFADAGSDKPTLTVTHVASDTGFLAIL